MGSSMDEKVVSQNDDLNKVDISQVDVEHLRQLSPEELVLEKKLRRKIDMIIMPLVILVYLMNYIDRLVLFCFCFFRVVVFFSVFANGLFW